MSEYGLRRAPDAVDLRQDSDAAEIITVPNKEGGTSDYLRACDFMMGFGENNETGEKSQVMLLMQRGSLGLYMPLTTTAARELVASLLRAVDKLDAKAGVQ